MGKKTLIGAYEDFIDKQTNERKKAMKKRDITTLTSEQETNNILEAIEEFVWYDMPEAERDAMKTQRIKSGEVIYVLVKLLVDKGLLSFDDIVNTLRKPNCENNKP